MEENEKIVAIQSVSEKKVKIYGHGKFIKRGIPPYDVRGAFKKARETDIIELDNGQIVYGIECYAYDVLDKVNDFIGKREIEIVDILKYRGKGPEFLLDGYLDALLDGKGDPDSFPLSMGIVEFRPKDIEDAEIVSPGFKFECLDCGKDHTLATPEKLKLRSIENDIASLAFLSPKRKNNVLMYVCNNVIKIGAINNRFVAKNSNLNLPSVGKYPDKDNEDKENT